MNDIKNVPNRLLNQAAKEQSFRKQIIADITQLLRNPETAPILKLFIVLGLLVILGISFVFSVFILHTVYAIIRNAEYNPLHYAYIISILIVSLMVIAVPLVFKASTAEQSLRLDGSFNKIYRARFGG